MIDKIIAFGFGCIVGIACGYGVTMLIWVKAIKRAADRIEEKYEHRF